MSSILKALQKLEQEKKGRSTREPDIHGSITRKNIAKPARQNWIFPVSIFVVAALSITITYTLMKDRKQNDKQIGESVPANSKAQQTHVSVQTSDSPQNPAQISVDTPSSPTVSNLPVQPLSRISRPGLDRADTAPPPHSSIPVNFSKDYPPPREQVEHLKTESSVPKHTDTSPTLPALTINGIASQKDDSSSIAVVNGVSVSEGSIIQGATVEKIFTDRIRFSQNGKSFEIPFGKGEHQQSE